ncbi:MAG: FIST signal transduction protein [Flavobacterium sp.]
MKQSQYLINLNSTTENVYASVEFDPAQANLVLAFAERTTLDTLKPYAQLKQKFPNASILISSASGQMTNNKLVEEQVVVTAIQFEHTPIKTIEIQVDTTSSASYLGKRVQNELMQADLTALLVISEGSHVNGTDLVDELKVETNHQIPIFGGIAGDGYLFEKTIVGLNRDAVPNTIVIVGFYGNRLQFGFGSEGGWSDFGPEREVTLSDKNKVFKIGDRYALDIYKEYLGKYAEELPGSSLYFPLSMKESPDAEPVVRTILSIDEEEKSMTFAGNLPMGSLVKFMKSNSDKLIDASYNAASNTLLDGQNYTKIALLISCVGRKIVLGDRVEEEIEAVREVLGKDVLLFGFYSYGEITPNTKKVGCDLQNQTMTITTLFES